MIYTPEELIISGPKRHLHRHATHLVNFLMFLALVGYALRWLFSLVAWIVGFYILKEASHNVSLWRMLKTLITSYILLLVLGVVTLMAWAAYNRYRYGGKKDKHRVKHHGVGIETISEDFGVPVGTIKVMRDAKYVVYLFDDHDNLLGVEMVESVAAVQNCGCPTEDFSARQQREGKT